MEAACAQAERGQVCRNRSNICAPARLKQGLQSPKPRLSALDPKFQDNENSQCASIFPVRRFELLNSVFDFLDALQNLSARKYSCRIVVCLVTFLLHLNEQCAKFLNLRRKIQIGQFGALPSGMSVFKRSIRLPPCGLTPRSPGGADYHVGATLRQRMKQGVVRGADGSSQVSGARTTAARSASQTLG